MENQVRVADPTFLGYFIDKGAASAAKVVRKVSKIIHTHLFRKILIFKLHLLYISLWKKKQAYPQEQVGVFVRRGKGGPLTVVEYSELDQSMASAINQRTGRLQYCWSNVKSISLLLLLLMNTHPKL